MHGVGRHAAGRGQEGGAREAARLKVWQMQQGKATYQERRKGQAGLACCEGVIWLARGGGGKRRGLPYRVWRRQAELVKSVSS